MKTTQASNETLLVWTIIVSLFAMLTVISVNFDRIREFSVKKKGHDMESFHFVSGEYNPISQPGDQAVLAQ